MFQTSGEVFVPLFWGVGTLMVINIYSGIIGYVFSDMVTLNMMMLKPFKSHCIIMMIFPEKSLCSHLIGGVGVLDTLDMMSIGGSILLGDDMYMVVNNI